MKTFQLTYSDFKKWLLQNDGEISDVVEGCLLDNYFIACKNGVAIAYETYKNCWTSVYTVKFERVHSSSELFDDWKHFSDSMEA